MADTRLTRDRIEALLRKMATTKIVVVGDAMLDVYLVGEVDRVSPEAPVPVVTVHASRQALGGAANVAAKVSGPATFDPWLAIQDKDGKILAAAEDSILVFQDCIASVIAPASGDYLIQIRETSFGGRDDYHYRLHVGTFPRPTVVYPPCGQAGDTVKVRFIGDVAGEFEQSLKLPDAPREKFGVFALAPPDPQGAAGVRGIGAEAAPSPNWMRVTRYGTALESEPNDTREQAGQPRDVPIVFNGILSQPGDHDWFRFRAKKGQNLQVSVFARRLRSPLDSSIQVVNPNGSVVAENDDAAGPDSSLAFKPDVAGDYAVVVRDHLKRGGPDYVYCLEIAPVEPSLSVKIPEVARNDTQSRQYIAVPRGNSASGPRVAKMAMSEPIPPAPPPISAPRPGAPLAIPPASAPI